MQKNNVVRKNWEFQDIIQSRKQHVSKSIILYYKKNKSGSSRIGISISKKFLGAVGRNRIKRQTRAALDEVNKWDLSYDMVLIVRKRYIDLPYEDKVKEIKKILERLENGKR